MRSPGASPGWRYDAEHVAGTTPAPLRLCDLANADHPSKTRSASQATVTAELATRRGFDFSTIRIRDDSEAHRLAAAVRAQAVTFGNQISFAAGRFALETHAGQQLLAHELVHVAQQSAAGGATAQRKAEAGHTALDIPALAQHAVAELDRGERAEAIPALQSIAARFGAEPAVAALVTTKIRELEAYAALEKSPLLQRDRST